jgi:hypothetical protein
VVKKKEEGYFIHWRKRSLTGQRVGGKNEQENKIKTKMEKVLSYGKWKIY